jgi:4'-phosphopantetheinyl transferase
MAVDESPWPRPAVLPPLGGTGVHLWYARLDSPDLDMAELEGALSADERAHAARLRIATVRARFIAGRGLLRLLLLAYIRRDGHECLDAQPGVPGAPVAQGAACSGGHQGRQDARAANLRFALGPHGKPALAAPWAADGLEFNLAHSEDHVLFGVARNRRLGVDVEVLRPMPEALDLARSHFTPAEARGLALLPDEQRSAAFLAVWTRKEALLKATGEGITRSLGAVVVPLAPEISPQTIQYGEGGIKWTLESFRPTAEAIAALAVEASAYQLQCLQLTPEALRWP